VLDFRLTPRCSRDLRPSGLLRSNSLPTFRDKISIEDIFQLRSASLLRLIVRSGLDVPTFATRRLHACHHARTPSDGRWNCGREMSGNFCLNADFHVTFRDPLHAVRLRHETDGFTSPPNFFALKIRRLRPGANPRTWVPKASTLPLDHGSRYPLKIVCSETLVRNYYYSLLYSPVQRRSHQRGGGSLKLLRKFLFVFLLQVRCFGVSGPGERLCPV